MGEWRVVVEIRRSCCVLLFSREGNATRGERERIHDGEEGGAMTEKGDELMRQPHRRTEREKMEVQNYCTGWTDFVAL